MTTSEKPEQAEGAVLAGWKLVPIEPTLEMIRAFFAGADDVGKTVIEPRICAAYRAMLAASPQHSATEEHPALTPLSEKERRMRKPPAPETLVGALHDEIGIDTGPTRQARAARVVAAKPDARDAALSSKEPAK